ncbi:inorganic phosphate transporter [Paracoccus sp. (in: a-proteobacteria)]|uniref:inorganic phosphate transporter n=1 Tax=Paracoccus sp. TaxID=267 RepID=UPI003A880B07
MKGAKISGARHRRQGFHTLDKDLGRLSYTEMAKASALRPVLVLGLAVLALVAGLIMAIGMTGRADHATIRLGAGLLVACWLGLAIGSNDVANSLGPAVGAGAIGILPGLILVALAEIAGAGLAGGEVTHRLANGIFDPGLLQPGAQPQLMLAALIGAAVWISLATGLRLPVSTSHSVVGAIIGASSAALGVLSVNWGTLLTIALGWILSPVAAGAVAAGVLIFVTRQVGEARDRTRAALLWLPLLVGAMAGFFIAYLGLLIAGRLQVGGWPPVIAGLIAAAGAGWVMRLRIAAETLRHKSRPRLKYLFAPPLVAGAAIMAFAHGANDVGNVAGPLSAILSRTGADGGVPLPVLMMAGVAIAAGTVLFGRRLVVMVGGGITRLNPVRAFCVSLATGLIVLVASGAGLPVSTTHVAVGGIFGVGFAREWLERRVQAGHRPFPAEETRRRLLVRRSHVVTISMAWLITVPATALLGGGAWLLIALAAGR